MGQGRAPVLRLHHDELIVDNFAGGGGASLGIEWGLGRSPDIAINHDREAIAMHAANHPDTRHYCEDVWKIDPREACKGRPVGLAWFSPDCKHFSKAKGGRPVDKKIRGLAWIVIRWAKAVRPRVICLENVEEFEDWGPLGPDNLPDRSRIGLTFRIWKGKLEALGYKVEFRELVAADYGTPTTRKRLFLVARCDGRPIVWPQPTHGKGREAWRTAAECIDWSLPTYSIFLNKTEAKPYRIVRPLAENTMRRIARGMKKFIIDNPDPFIVGVGGRMGQSPERPIDRPMQTITSKGDAAITIPYLTRVAHGEQDKNGKKRGKGEHTLNEPLPTVLATRDFALTTPYLIEHANSSNLRSFAADEPLRTQCAQVKGGHFALVAPFMVPRYGEDPNRNGGAGQPPRVLSVERPMPTIVPTQNGAQLVAAFLAKHYGGHETPGSPLDKAIDTVTAKDHNALVASSIVKLKGTAQHGQQLDLPLHTVQAGGNHYAQVNAFLIAYFGNEKDGGMLPDPMRTVTSRDRFALVTVHGEPYVIADIGMRMLAPRELYRAQGFPDTYRIDFEFEGKKLPKDAQVRMVGNSVCPPLAAAIARAQFEDQVIEVAA